MFSLFYPEVESWNPLTDTVPIHSWIHPWLPLMQARLEPLYSPIRNKLANALQKWHPSDSSAKLILQPWKDVFTPGSWEAFMVKNIVPKLGETGQTVLDFCNLLVATFSFTPRTGHVDMVASVTSKNVIRKFRPSLCLLLLIPCIFFRDRYFRKYGELFSVLFFEII